MQALNTPTKESLVVATTNGYIEQCATLLLEEKYNSDEMKQKKNRLC